MAAKVITIDSPIGLLSGIGPAYQKKLAHLGIVTVRDLLHHYPSRFLDYQKQTRVCDLKEKQTVSLRLTLAEPKRFMSRTGKLITEVSGSDKSGKIKLIWFNSPYISRLIKAGEEYLVAGKSSFWGGKIALVAPTIEPATSDSLHTHGLVPIYPQTEKVTSRFLRGKIRQALQMVELIDPLSETADTTKDLPPYPKAIAQIHFPKTKAEYDSADQRLAFNFHLSAALGSLIETNSLPPSVTIPIDKRLHQRLTDSLPFQLTAGQEKAIASSYRDLTKPTFTHRLIQGETGSGKTMIVFFIAAQALAAKKSICLLAPTEILAHQHYQTFIKLGLPKEQTVLVTAQNPLKEVRPKPSVFIGTHALLNQIKEKLPFPLVAVIVDEQHRFGVKQREQLLKRNPLPHLFNLTATPIPRTLALGLFGEVRISTLKEKPKNRLPVKTWLMNRDRFQKSDAWLKEQIKSGSKIFAVAPVINENESQKEIENVQKLFHEYSKRFASVAEVFLIHGRMKSEEITANLNRFGLAKNAILVSTSMIEVGVDIPEADIIIIHSAGNFGLASLHQLRGRVGRRDRQGYCLLIDENENGNERLDLLTKYDSGLILSKKDLKLRGAGEIYGAKQHGRLPVRLKHFWNKMVYRSARSFAQKIMKQSPNLAPVIAERLSNW